jgi:hypothetical protein
MGWSGRFRRQRRLVGGWKRCHSSVRVVARQRNSEREGQRGDKGRTSKVLELFRFPLRHLDDARREVGHLCNADTKGLSGSTRSDLVQERNVVVLRARPSGRDERLDLEVLDVWQLLFERAELEKVRGEEGEGFNLFGDVPRVRAGRTKRKVSDRARGWNWRL